MPPRPDHLLELSNGFQGSLGQSTHRIPSRQDLRVTRLEDLDIFTSGKLLGDNDLVGVLVEPICSHHEPL